METHTLANTRNYKFDNYKVFLIFLVVLGHFIEPSSENTVLLTNIKWLIFTFHMPAFIFISGYFTTKKSDLKKLFEKFIIPYLAFEFIYYFVYSYIIDKDTSLALISPKFSLWFLLAIFFYKATIHLVVKIPYHLVISIAFGLLIGFSDIPSNFLSVPRILYFYPFFIIGYHFRKKDLFNRFFFKIDSKKFINSAFIFSLILIFFFLIFLCFEPFHINIDPKVMYGRYSYDYLHQTAIIGILIRSLCYISGLLLTLAFLLIMPNKQYKFSELGKKTLSIYLFHGIVYNILKDSTKLLDNIDTVGGTFELILMSLITVLVFSLPPFVKFVNFISSIKITAISITILTPIFKSLKYGIKSILKLTERRY